MSYLEKAKRALHARSAATSPARCSRCLELDALGIVVLRCSCGCATHLSRLRQMAEDRKVLRQALRGTRGRCGESGLLRLVEESDDD